MRTLRSLFIFCLALPLLSSSVGAQDAAGANPFTDHGIGATVAEARGVVTTQTADGRSLVIGVALDQAARGYLVVTDIDSGKTTQVYCPVQAQNYTFGSLMASNGRFYTAQGGDIGEFDPQSGKWLWHGRPVPTSCYLSFAEDSGGMIWAGGLGCQLVSYNPATQEAKSYGRMDPAEEYLQSLAADSAGWVYGGIGTARQNIVACNIATGKMVQLAAEEDRVHGTASVYATEYGKVSGSINGKTFVLFEGKATPAAPASLPKAIPTGKVYYGQVHTTFPDGRKLVAYSMPDKWMTIQTPKTGDSKRIRFEYESGGASITSLGLGPEGIVYASTCHPMHFVRLDARSGQLSDYGAVPGIGGGNMCSIAALGKYVMGAVYSSGTMWLFDTTAPFNPAGSREDLALKADALIKTGSFTNGHFTYLTGYDAAFFCGDTFGAQGSFKLRVAEGGSYYLQLLPLLSPNYCRVQFALDGQPLGKPLDASAMDTQTGTMQVFGPLKLAAGEHAFTTTLLDTSGKKPWFSICSMQLSKERLPDPNAGKIANPYVVAGWHDDICRPRAALAHPDGKHFLMAGYAGYGLVGGGIGIYNIETRQSQLLSADKDLLPGHSCIALAVLPDGDLVGGTDIAAPGGGHPTATDAELYLIDWKTRKLNFHMAPVPGQSSIVSLTVGPDGLVYGLTGGSVFFTFDPAARKVLHTEPWATYGGAVRHGLHTGPVGAIYALMSNAIIRVAPGGLKHELLARPPVPITAGGALVNGRLCYAANTNVWTYRIPGL
ncbi:MAG: hypothetical protein ABFD96_17530 [Armatimonadia bacterium]